LPPPPPTSEPNAAALAQKIEGADQVALHNPLAIATRDGVVHFIYCVNYSRCFIQRSDDDGETFSPPTEITAAFGEFDKNFAWKVLATGPGTASSCAAVDCSSPSGSPLARAPARIAPSCTATIYSDDAGKTWHAGAIVGRAQLGEFQRSRRRGAGATARVMINVRHESEPHVRAVAVKRRWRRTVGARSDSMTNCPSRSCMASLARHKQHALILQPEQSVRPRAQEPHDQESSEDDGRRWPASRVIEEGPSAYSDLAVADDGTIYCPLRRAAVPENPPGSGGP
jgi:sialidase-1